MWSKGNIKFSTEYSKPKNKVLKWQSKGPKMKQKSKKFFVWNKYVGEGSEKAESRWNKGSLKILSKYINDSVKKCAKYYIETQKFIVM